MKQTSKPGKTMVEDQDHPNINRNVHPPVVALLFILAAYILGRFVPIPFAAPIVLRYAGLGITFIGLLLGLTALVEFRRAHTTLDPHGSVKKLVTTGIYRYSRNPIYLGFVLMVIGLPLNSGLYSGIVAAPFFAMAIRQLVVEREEAYLEKKFKDQYTSYKARVRRWL
jgi:protein-S-isoprenylcysteine O-methyltransferase Ste14